MGKLMILFSRITLPFSTVWFMTASSLDLKTYEEVFQTSWIDYVIHAAAETKTCDFCGCETCSQGFWLKNELMFSLKQWVGD